MQAPRLCTQPLSLCVAALYQFCPLGDCAALREVLTRVCRLQGVRGTLLLAREGINGTIAGSQPGIDAVLEQIRAIPGCAQLEVKLSSATTMPFHRMKVRIRPEIVTMGQPDIDPLLSAGTYVVPHDWNTLIADPATVVIDTRNDFEVAVGTFAGAVDPQTRSFSDFPAWFRAHRDALLDGKTKVAMFCTGGIRCEKSTAFLRAEGVSEVYHLKGGILKYLDDVAPADSLWRGECFVFDQRVAVGHGLAPGTHSQCHACGTPVSPQDLQSAQYEDGVSCPACHATRTDEQRAAYRERHRQEALATAQGRVHVGAVLPVRPASPR